MKTMIGLTGGYCSGKSQAAAILESMGFANVDADRLAHKALQLCSEKLVAVFGKSILASDGSIDRKVLGRIVFADPDRLSIHESIVHPVIIALMEEEIASSERICVNAPLLYRTDFVRRCDLIVEIHAPLWLRIKRGKERDGMGTIDILRRIASQRSLWKLRPANNPPVVLIDNSRGLEALKAALREAIAKASKEKSALS